MIVGEPVQVRVRWAYGMDPAWFGRYTFHSADGNHVIVKRDVPSDIFPDLVRYSPNDVRPNVRAKDCEFE